MSTVESATYVVEITLLTLAGELPTDKEVEQLVQDQMAGELDEHTGLFAGVINLKGRKEDDREDG